MQPVQLFQFCPRCAAAITPGSNPLRCLACELSLYFNPTVAVGVWIHNPQGEVLLIRRAKDPARGKYGIPGGFVDIGETAEEGLRREVREEVNLKVDEIEFLMSCPNQYLYRDVTYPVCDLIFRARAIDPEAAQSLDDVDGHEWRHPRAIAPEELAFPSMQQSLRLVQS